MGYQFQRHLSVGCPDLGDLERHATSEGYSFVTRTRLEWESGANRFDQPGETFYLALSHGRPVGTCGLNRDPYIDDPRVGRLRHLYVHPDHRRTGVAETLVMSCLSDAPAHFGQVRLRTSNPAADALYRSVGFQPIHDDTASHMIGVELLGG